MVQPEPPDALTLVVQTVASVQDIPTPTPAVDMPRPSITVGEEHQQPPDTPVLVIGLLRRSRRVCKRRYDCLDMETLRYKEI